MTFNESMTEKTTITMTKVSIGPLRVLVGLLVKSEMVLGRIVSSLSILYNICDQKLTRSINTEYKHKLPKLNSICDENIPIQHFPVYANTDTGIYVHSNTLDGIKNQTARRNEDVNKRV
jgi:hypothetical protein